MIFNNVITEDTDQLSNVYGIVSDPSCHYVHWLASIKSMPLAEVITRLHILPYPILCWSSLPVSAI